ncbi:MAG: hypothetical protein AAGK97_13920, partial [Bacteroidota bacterium]
NNFTINNGGDIGIGNEDPQWDLDVKAKTGGLSGINIDGTSTTNRVALRLDNNAFLGRTFSIFSSGGAAGVGRGKFGVRDELAGSNRFVIDSTGKAALGFDNPKTRLDINGALLVREADGNFAGSIQFSNNEFSGYNGSNWVTFGGVSSNSDNLIRDNDGDTKIDVEQLPDEDRIRFDIAGTNHITIEKNTGAYPRIKFENTSDNIVIGSGRAQTNRDANSILIGKEAGLNYQSNNSFNVFIGDRSGADGRGENIIGIGTNAFRASSSFNDLLDGTVAIGFNTFTQLSNGPIPGVAVGSNAGQLATLPGIFIGPFAGRVNEGNGNIYIGYEAGLTATTGGNNLCIGVQDELTTGSSNIMIGGGGGITTGSSNTFLGKFSSASGNYTNSTLIGQSASMTASNQVRLGNSFITSIGGFANWSNVSDSKFKVNIEEDIPGLAFIQKLRPVSYQLDLDKINAH